MRLDLHTHTHFSDGQYSALDVLQMAYANGANLCALTDHDTVQAYFHLQSQPDLLPDLVFLPGVEVSTENSLGKESHLLIHFPRLAMGTAEAFRRLSIDPPPNPTNDDLMELTKFEEELRRLCNSRITRARQCFDLLGSVHGLELSWDEFCAINKINQETGTADGTIGRPHIANYLISKGHCATINEAFDRFLATEPVKSIKKESLSLQYAIQKAIQLGGVPSLAHPCLKRDWPTARKIIEEAIGAGMRHLEVYHPSHTAEDIENLKKLCEECSLIKSIGTDFHGDAHTYDVKAYPGGYEDAQLHVSPEEKVELVRNLFIFN